jgi:hypothetical protein
MADAEMSAVLIPYNGTIPTGGDSLHDDLNVYYEVRIDSIKQEKC